MQQAISQCLSFLCEILPDKLRQLTEVELNARPQPDKWSKKEILGHLLDSAANNHHRFVRAQLEDTPTIFYDQDQWVRVQAYRHEDVTLLISFWEMYNRHLAHLINTIPSENLEKECRLKDGTRVTLAFLVTDYVQHLEHHLRQLVNY
jgi:hypothetical protein